MKVTVFYADKLYGEYKEWVNSTELPDGAYIRWISQRGIYHWYQIKGSSAQPINRSDVPKTIKAMCLLLNLSL